MSKSFDKLSRRERQIMDIIYQKGKVTVSDVLEAMDDSPKYSSVRTLLGILENKGFLKHEKDGRAYLYLPVIKHKQASHHALKQVVNIFFDGSVENVVTALIDMKSSKLSDEEFERLSEFIKAKREKGNDDV